jgi:predicted oxidoreductase
MDYVKLGTTGLDVSPVAIGAMTYGEPGRGHPAWSLGEQDSRLLIKHAIEQGINFFDTANVYSRRRRASGPRDGTGHLRPALALRAQRRGRLQAGRGAYSRLGALCLRPGRGPG